MNRHYLNESFRRNPFINSVRDDSVRPRFQILNRIINNIGEQQQERTNLYSRFLENTLNMDSENFYSHSSVLDEILDLPYQKEQYGKLPMMIFRKMKDNNLIIVPSFTTQTIYKKILDNYFAHIDQDDKNSFSMYKNTKTFINYLPKIKKIKKFCDKEKKDTQKYKQKMMFYKLCLDIFDDYFQKCEIPFYKVII